MMLMDDDSVRSESLECTDVTVPTIISGAINEPVSHFGQTPAFVTRNGKNGWKNTLEAAINKSQYRPSYFTWCIMCDKDFELDNLSVDASSTM